MKGRLLFAPWQVVYKYCDKSFINKPTFLNIVPQLIKKTYRAGTTWLYKFPCTIVAQAHIALITSMLVISAGQLAWKMTL